MSELEEKIKLYILSVLPKLSEDSLKQSVDKLLGHGIEDLEDLVYVKEDDMLKYLRPIQCRKLLCAWKNQSEVEKKRNGEDYLQHITVIIV